MFHHTSQRRREEQRGQEKALWKGHPLHKGRIHMRGSFGTNIVTLNCITMVKCWRLGWFEFGSVLGASSRIGQWNQRDYEWNKQNNKVYRSKALSALQGIQLLNQTAVKPVQGLQFTYKPRFRSLRFT